MVEIEWDGVELETDARHSVRERLRALASAVDPDGRARVRVEIVGERGEYRVLVAGRDRCRRTLDAQCRARDVVNAVDRAIELAMRRWRARAA